LRLRLRWCATNRKVADSIPACIIEFFIDIKSFRSHYGPGVESASNRNEYQEYFLGVKGGRCVRLTTLPPSCAFVTYSGNFNFLEPSGPLQTCKGTDLPFFFLHRRGSFMSKNELRLCAHSFQNNKHKLCINICHPWCSNKCQNYNKICFFAYP